MHRILGVLSITVALLTAYPAVTCVTNIYQQEDQKATIYEVYEITAYTADYESTRRQPSDPLYGITASGAVVKEGHTIAAPRDIPFGTKIYIPYFDTIFTVEDRGGAIRGNRLDVYMASRDEARAFGRRSLDVLILD